MRFVSSEPESSGSGARRTDIFDVINIDNDHVCLRWVWPDR
jgi:hypothetical protein